MIAIICAMSEERDAFLKLMKDVKTSKFEKINYHGALLDNKCYTGKLNNKDVVLIRSGVGKVYAAIVTTIVIKKFKPELIVNLGTSGSLSNKVNVNDVVVATRVADWDVDVPDWNRSIYSEKMSFACDERFIKLAKQLKTKTKVIFGAIVSGDEFVHKKTQVKTIMKFFPESLCCEMEGSSVANTCYAFGVNCAIVRSISDVTLVRNNYSKSMHTLNDVSITAANVCADIIKRY